jgi:hypothetical protein
VNIQNIQTEKIVSHGVQWLYVDIECENPAQALENVLGLFHKGERCGYNLESGSLSMGGLSAMVKLRGSGDETGIISLINTAVRADDEVDVENDYYLSSSTIERLRKLATMEGGKIPVQNWEDLDNLIGYSVDADEVAIINLPDGVSGRLVLIPQAFLDKFDRSDDVMVTNEVLSPHWGSKKYWVEPGWGESGGCWHGVPPDENYPDVYTGSLLTHRARVTYMPNSYIRDQVEFANKVESSKSTMTIEVEGIKVNV